MEELKKLLPKEILSLLEKYETERVTIGRSGNSVYYVKNFGYLKVSEDVASLKSERDRCLWLENRLNTPRVIAFDQCLHRDENAPQRAFLLTSEVKGKRLCDTDIMKDPEHLVTLLSEAITLFHSLDGRDCPFFAEQNAQNDITEGVICHGDFCLPNILYDGKSFGFVDLGGMGKGDPWLDYAWALWSLAYNLKTDAYNQMLLGLLNIPFDQSKYDHYTEF